MQEKKLENRVVCVPFESNEYSSIIKPPSKFKEALDSRTKAFPESFSADIDLGYKLKDSYDSAKCNILVPNRTIAWAK